MSSPTDKVIAALTAHGCEPKPKGDRAWESRCPAHEGSRRNLDVIEGDNGGAVLRCHHEPSCSVKDIAAAIGLTMGDLFAEDGAKPKKAAKKSGPGFSSLEDAIQWLARKIEATSVGQSWIYREADGSPVLVITRYELPGDKSYRPFHKRDGWHCGDPPGKLPLYHLPDVPKAGFVVAAEGEKCADLLRGLGVPATTASHGAGSAKRTDWTPTAGLTVAIVPDHDEPGEKYAAEVAAQVLAAGGTPKIVRLPGLKEEGDDVEQWLQLQRDEGLSDDEIRTKLEALIDQAEPSEGGSVGFVGSPGHVSPEFEGPPKPITAELRPVPKLDPSMIPGPLQPWLVDIAERGSFPIDYPAAAGVVALGGLLGRRMAMRPKRRDSWLVAPNLWGAVVGRPGVFKSPAVEEAMKPLHRLEAEARERHREIVKAHNAKLMVAEARADAAKAELKKRAKQGATDDQLEAFASLALGGGEEAGPTLKRYLVNDSTVEKLGELLAENPNGLVCYRDELVGFLKSMEKQGHENDRAFYLESWNGLGCYSYDRIGRGTIFIPSVTTAVFGSIQPGPFARYLRGAVTGEDADGFITRFQLLVYPDPPGEFTNVDRWPDSAAKNTAFQVFRDFDAFDPIARGCRVDEDRGVPYLSFDDEAQEFFDEWREALENRLRSPDIDPLIASHLSKYRKLMPALALIFHAIDSHASATIGPVGIKPAMMAAAWCEYLEAHARRIYQAARDGDPEIAIDLADRIKQSLPNPFTFRQVAQKGWSGLTTVDDVRKAVGILEDRNWVRVTETKPGAAGGRVSEQVWINPCIAGVKGVMVA